MKLPRPARAQGIPTALAIEAAMEANRVCLGNTYKTTAMITDSAGVPIVVISNDGAAAVTQRIAMSKVQAVLKYHMTSGEVAAKAAADPAFKAEIAANPMIDTARQGAVPDHGRQRDGRRVRRVRRAGRRQGRSLRQRRPGQDPRPGDVSEIGNSSRMTFRAACVQLRSSDDVAENIRETVRLVREAAARVRRSSPPRKTPP